MIKNLKLMNLALKITAFTFVMNLYGCDKVENDNKKIIRIQVEFESESYDLKNNDNYVIIETIDSAGNKDIHLAEKVQLSKLDNPSTDINKYSDYLDLDKSFPTNTYLYLDLDGDVLTVHYTDPNIYNRNDLEGDSFIIKEIISEISAYEQAKEKYGDKEQYYKDEIELMMFELKEKYKGKQKIK